MKFNAMKLAVASALAAGAVAQANAAYLEPWTVTGSETYTLRVGGATAQDQGIVLLMRRLCSNGTMVRVTGSNQTAIMCEANGGDSAPIAAGTKLVVYKNSAGGSGNGVNPVANGTTLAFLNLASLTQTQYTTASTCTLTTVASTADFADYKQYACGANISNANSVPDAGISDVEPALLGWVSGASGALSVFSGPQVIFGLPVSKNFRDALQTAQGKTAGSDSEADMPSLNKAQIGSIFAGGIIPITRFSDISGNQLSTAGLGATTIQVCRRIHTGTTLSGTAASAKAYWLNEGCAKGVQSMVTLTTANNSIPPVAANRIHEYNSTPRVIGCLNSMHANNKYAVGMASLESVPGSAYTNTGDAAPFDTDTGNWRWVKVDGYAPTLLNVAQGKYDFVYEATWQHRASGNPAGELTGDPKTLFDKVVATNSAATVIKELDNAFVEPWGTSGLIGRPSSGTSTAPSNNTVLGVLTAAEVIANPINTWTRAAAGAPNSCNPPYITRETGLDMLQ